MVESLIFQQSQTGRSAKAQLAKQDVKANGIPTALQRQTNLGLPEVSELQAVRHYTRLSRLNFSIDTHFYPLGSCTMKYNPRGVHRIASQAAWLQMHPHVLPQACQGVLQCMYELQDYLKAITGMNAVCLTPMAGSQGELAGVAMMRAYHNAHSDKKRCEILIPDAAHGTNPASAAMCGYRVREITTDCDGDIDLDGLEKALGPETAGIMLTNPSTLGVFDRNIEKIAGLVHQAGALLYYDGANLNAILGKVCPGDMGFDVVHLNLHKTFATPHGGGGPGSGPIAVSEKLNAYLPVPLVDKKGDQYCWVNHDDRPESIGRLSAFMGNVGILLRAYAYIRMLGYEGLQRVAEFATLNANYLMVRLQKAGFHLAYPKRRASHEFIISLANEKKQFGINALDVAKRLLDYGFHAPTVYFPLLIPECLLIEPTETECKQTLDEFVDALQAIRNEAANDPGKVQKAPQQLLIKRLNEVQAARTLDVKCSPD